MTIPTKPTTGATTSKKLSQLNLKPLDTSSLSESFLQELDSHSLEEVIELKISRFFDQIGTYYPENVYSLMLSKLEKPLLRQLLRRVGGNQVQASKILGINRNTLRKKIKTHGI